MYIVMKQYLFRINKFNEKTLHADMKRLLVLLRMEIFVEAALFAISMLSWIELNARQCMSIYLFHLHLFSDAAHHSSIG